MTGNGISTIEKTATSGLVDTYTITYTNGNTTTFTVTNGEDGEVTQTQFDELAQRTTDLENNQIIKSAIGTSIDIDDSADAYNYSIKMIGNTTQNSTTGKNFLDSNVPNSTKGGVTLYNNGDGSYSLNGTFITNAAFNLTTTPIILENGKTYTQSIKVIRGTMGGSVVPSFKDSNGQVQYNYFNGNSTKTTTDIMTLNSYAYYVANGTTVDCTFKVQLEEGPTATEWEEYTGREPSPNLNYPQELKNSGDGGSINEIFRNVDNTETQTLSFPLQTGQKFMQDDYLADDGIHHVRKQDTVSGTEAIFTDAKLNGNYLCNKKLSGNLTGQTLTFGESVTDAIVEYELAEETIEPYTPTQQTAYNQLKKSRTYKNVTHISSEDETPATIELEYYQDVNTWVAKVTDLEERVLALESQ